MMRLRKVKMRLSFLHPRRLILIWRTLVCFDFILFFSSFFLIINIRFAASNDRGRDQEETISSPHKGSKCSNPFQGSLCHQIHEACHGQVLPSLQLSIFTLALSPIFPLSPYIDNYNQIAWWGRKKIEPSRRLRGRRRRKQGSRGRRKVSRLNCQIMLWHAINQIDY